MPELPEVETINTAVAKRIGFAKIEAVEIRNFHLRNIIPHDLCKKIIGASIKKYQRLAKYMIWHLDNGYSLLWHMGMTGTLTLSDIAPVPAKHDHVIIKTSNGFIVYNDPRRFGLLSLCRTQSVEDHHFFATLGPDPFAKKFTATYLYERLHHKKGEIKPLLLDQRLVAGIGNIYASEILYDARISPLRDASSLSQNDCAALVKSAKKILQAAIRAGGSTLKDYKKPDGKLGYFQNSHCVYNKKGQQCPHCICRQKNNGGIKKIVQKGRSTFYCERLQK